jgi:hypothetical protein
LVTGPKLSLYYVFVKVNLRALPPASASNALAGFEVSLDDEIKAIFAYLKSTAPVKNIVPPAAAPVLMGKK